MSNKELFFLTAILLSVVVGCKNKPTSLTGQAYRDSLSEDSSIKVYMDRRMTELKNPRNVDSIEQRKAYGNLRFGMKSKQVVFNKTYNYIEDIGRWKYMLSPTFDHLDSLYLLQIESYSSTANYYDTDVRDQYLTLRYTIAEKFGQPDVGNAYPSFLSMEPKRIQFPSVWTLGDKIIKVGVGETEHRYYACCWIYSDKMKTRVDDYESQESNKKISTDKEKF